MKKLIAILGFWLACLVPSLSVAEDPKQAEEPIVFSYIQCGQFATSVALFSIAQEQKHFKLGSDLYKFMPPPGKAPDQIQDLLKATADLVVASPQLSADEHFDGAYEYCKAFQGIVPLMTHELRVRLNQSGT